MVTTFIPPKVYSSIRIKNSGMKKQISLEIPLPLREGARWRGNLSDYQSPSP
jgi:hypothetical protein